MFFAIFDTEVPPPAPFFSLKRLLRLPMLMLLSDAGVPNLQHKRNVNNQIDGR